MKHRTLCALLAAAAMTSVPSSVLPLQAQNTDVSVPANVQTAAENPAAETEPAKTAAEVLAQVKDVAPVISEDGNSIVLPASSNEDYEVQLYGCSNEAVISMDKKIHTPLEDMDVYVMYKVVNKSDETDFALDQRAEVSLTIPGRFTHEEADNARPQILPGIQEWKGGVGRIAVTDQTRVIIKDAALMDTAQILNEYASGMLGRTFEISTDTPAAGDIVLSLDDNLAQLGKEGYTLNSFETIDIASSEAKGVLYGCTTLIQMLMNDPLSVPQGMIRDYPAYEVRSCMQDVARFYMPLDYLEEVTKYMAFFKLNEFHVHINDNGGEQGRALRVESKKYPALNSSLNPDEVYSQEDYRDYQKRSARYGIEIVTEIDTPAHSGFISDYDSSLMLDGYHINLSNENVLPFIKSLLDEYLDGDDPVFQGSKFNIGTDEYDKTYSELVRSYMNELIEYVTGKGREVRMWASLGTNGFNGTTPVSNKAVGHYWSASWASYDEMLNMGYPCINNNDGNLYTVPGAGYYHDYIELENLYNNWEANYLVPSYHIARSNPLMLGSEAACWYDAKTGMSQFDIFDRTREQIALMSEKNWFGSRREGQSAEEFTERVENLGKKGPISNPARHVDSVSDSVLSYDFETIDGNQVLDGTENHYDGTFENTTVTADPYAGGSQVLRLNGEGSLSMPFDSMGFPYTIAFDLYLDGEQEENAVLFTGKDGVMMANYQGSGKIAYQRKGYTYIFDVQIPKNIWTRMMLTCDHSTERLYFNGIFAAEGVYHQVTGASKQASSTFVLPLEEVGSGIHGAIDNIEISSEALSYEEITGLNLIDYSNRALNRPVSVSGLEVNDGRFTAEMANDGDHSTRVSLERKDNAWWQVDLEAVQNIDKLVIDWGERPNSYQIQVSLDGENWTTVHQDLACVEKSSGTETIKFDQTVRARYVRYQQLKQFLYENNSYYSGNFREFEVWAFGTETLPTVVEARNLLETTVSTPENAGMLEKLALSIDLLEQCQSRGSTEEMALVIRRMQDICDAIKNGDRWQTTDCDTLKALVLNYIDTDAYSDASVGNYQLYYRFAMGSLLDGTLNQASIDSITRSLQESIDNLEVRDFISASSSRVVYQNNVPANLLDDNPFSYFWQNGEQKVGDYVEFRFRSPQQLSKITVSSDKCGGDTLGTADVKLSMDGKSWKTAGSLETKDLQSVEFEPETALYVRIELTSAKSNWWKMNEVIFNDGQLVDYYWLEEEVKIPADTAGCTTSSIAAWNQALAEAEAMIAEKTATQKEVNAAIEHLRSVREALEVIGDLSPVESAVTGYEQVDASLYTNYSMSRLNTALEKARALIADPSDAGSRTIANTLQEMEDAFNRLKLLVNGVDTSAVDQEVENALTSALPYSVNSWQSYMDLKDRAEAYASGEKGLISEAGVQEYASALVRARTNLKQKVQSNAALHKPVTCSGLEVDREDVRADKVTDGDLTTRIALHQKDDSWITIDLEEVMNIDRVIIRWKEKPAKYKIQVSLDNENWTDVWQDLNCDDGAIGDDIIDFDRIDARYVRYQQIKMQRIGYSGTCTEFEVYPSDQSLFTDELTWQVNQAKVMDTSALGSKAKEKVSSALAAGETALAGSDQQVIDAAAKTLFEIRLAALDQGDVSMLAAAVAHIAELNEESYTPASWNALMEAAEKAQSVLDDFASQNVIDETLNALITAQNALIVKADKTLLAASVEYAEGRKAEGALEGLNELAAREFDAALTEAKEVLADTNADQNGVNASWLRLCKAIHMLSFKSDKSELQLLVEQAEIVNLDLYADGDAKDAFVSALAYARDVLADPAALSDQSIAAAVERLSNAIASLQIKADTSLLAWLIEQVKDTDLSLYIQTDSFVQALEAAKAVLASPQSQEEVNQAVESLNTAWMNLRRKPDESLLRQLADAREQLAGRSWKFFSTEIQNMASQMIGRIDAALEDKNLSEDEAKAILSRAQSLLALTDSEKPAAAQVNAASVKTSVNLKAQTGWSIVTMIFAAAALLGLKRRNQK